MKLSTRIDRVQEKLRPPAPTGVIIYRADTGECSGAYQWKPGMPHKGQVVIINDVPRPVGFKGTIITRGRKKE